MGLAVKPKKIGNIDCEPRISGLYLNSSLTTSVNIGPDWSITEASYSHPLCSGREPVTIMALPSYSARFISCYQLLSYGCRLHYSCKPDGAALRAGQQNRESATLYYAQKFVHFRNLLGKLSMPFHCIIIAFIN